MLKIGNQMFYGCFLAILGVLTATAVFLWSASARSAPVNQTVVLTDVRLINGEGGSPLEHAAIVIERDRIVSLGPGDKLHWPNSAHVINYRNKTVLQSAVGYRETAFLTGSISCKALIMKWPDVRLSLWVGDLPSAPRQG
jgi:hypothetical protein